MSDWFQHEWCATFVFVLGHFLWQGTLIALLTAFAMRVVRSAAVRYRLTLSALLLMVVCPILTLDWLKQPDHSTSELATRLIDFQEIASGSIVRSEVADAEMADAAYASNQQSVRPVDDAQPGGKKADPTVNLLKVGEETESVPGSFRIFAGESLERKVSLHLDRTPRFEVLTKARESAGLKLNLDVEALKSRGYTRNMAITIDVDRVSLRDALTQILKRYEDLSFMLDGNEILVSTRKQFEAKEKAGQQQERAAGVEFLKQDEDEKLFRSHDSQRTSRRHP